MYSIGKQRKYNCLPHREELKNRHMLIRKVFNINSKFKNAHIDITADDYYKLYINGKFVGQGPAPGYYFHYNYNRYDITSYFKRGQKHNSGPCVLSRAY